MASAEAMTLTDNQHKRKTRRSDVALQKDNTAGKQVKSVVCALFR